MRWIPEIAAFVAALMIGLHTEMTWWQIVLLYVALDLMTASGKQLKALRQERT